MFPSNFSIKTTCLASPERDDDPARGDKRPANVNGCGGRLIEPDLGQHLGHQEKQHHIHAQQFAKIPVGNVDRKPVKSENRCPGDEKNCPASACGAVKAALAKETLPGALPQLMAMIAPAVAKAAKEEKERSVRCQSRKFG